MGLLEVWTGTLDELEAIAALEESQANGGSHVTPKNAAIICEYGAERLERVKGAFHFRRSVVIVLGITVLVAGVAVHRVWNAPSGQAEPPLAEPSEQDLLSSEPSLSNP